MRVLIADGHPLMRVGVRRALEADGFEIVGEAASSEEMLSLIPRRTPEVVLLDLAMPGKPGLACIHQIVAEHPAVRVVVLTEAAEPDQIEAAFKHGACGYVVKNIENRDLPSAIRLAANRTAYHAYGLPALQQDSVAKAAGLTDQELAVVKAVARGLTNQTIARELFVTEQTIKFHLTNVYKKLGLANRTEAARWVYQRGLITDPALEADIA
jgi:DNA-binding NarL/FixJ family response regulator